VVGVWNRKKGKCQSNTRADNHILTTTLSLVTERRISSKVIVCIHIYRERVRERESIGTNNTNVRVTSTNKLLGMDQILPSVR
jgi:hypothetical protein